MQLGRSFFSTLVLVVTLVLGMGVGACSTRKHVTEERAAAGLAADPGASAALAAFESCENVPVFTLEQLQRGEGADQRIAVEGIPVANVLCTRARCVDGSSCCNSCGGGYSLKSSTDYGVTLSGRHMEGCSGRECDVTCRPFGASPTNRFRFVGVHHFQAAGQTSTSAKSELEVETYCPAK